MTLESDKKARVKSPVLKKGVTLESDKKERVKSPVLKKGVTLESDKKARVKSSIVKKRVTPDVDKKIRTKSPIVTKGKSPAISKTESPMKSAVLDVSRLYNRHCSHYPAGDDPEFRMEVVLPHAPKEPYDPKYQALNNVHMGQRKLMLSEIQLLNTYYKKNVVDPIVVYVGAAPGIHLLELSRMFPKVRFVLYDGARFDARLKNMPQVFEVHEGEFFTDATCEYIRKRFFDTKHDNILFISDIRLGENTREKFEAGVTRDMEMQQNWVQALRPKMSLLKFRMSYHMKHCEKLKYLKGKILFQVWPKALSGETRLLVSNEDRFVMAEYDFKSYEEALFYHNKYVR